MKADHFYTTTTRNTIIVIILMTLLALTLSPILMSSPALADGTTVIYSYDDAGRLISVEYPNGATIDYDYDNAGNLLSRITSAGAWSPWVYDTSPKNFVISVGELLYALSDYLDSTIIVTQLLQVLALYLNP